jgi:hypothetical protein
MRHSIVRTAGLFGLWLILTSVNPTDIPGVLAAVMADQASLRLLPSGP